MTVLGRRPAQAQMRRMHDLADSLDFQSIHTRSIPMRKLPFLFANIIIAIAVATTGGCASTKTSEGTGEYFDDSWITTRVKAAILNEPTLKSSEINVETFKGEVQLSGFVSSEDNIRKAVTVTKEVKGVKTVKNDMRVRGR
jgi:osmotically-inducible protein OsmY